MTKPDLYARTVTLYGVEPGRDTWRSRNALGFGCLVSACAGLLLHTWSWPTLSWATFHVLTVGVAGELYRRARKLRIVVDRNGIRISDVLLGLTLHRWAHPLDTPITTWTREIDTNVYWVDGVPVRALGDTSGPSIGGVDFAGMLPYEVAAVKLAIADVKAHREPGSVSLISTSDRAGALSPTERRCASGDSSSSEADALAVLQGDERLGR
jgi:hypothetical protein